MDMDYRVGLKLPKTPETLYPFPERLEEWTAHDNKLTEKVRNTSLG